ncbi:MAG TPA: ABC transporter substrate-binding protein [Candidatus Limnocylindria bacterium]|nr:ABC transporter substrate-binding protein [Candidatus Limnocylindria bacterium]
MPTTERLPSWRASAVLVTLALALTACTTGDASPSPASGESPAGESAAAASGDTQPADSGEVVMISSQLVPTEEQETMRNEILADFAGTVEFIGADPGPFNDQVRAQEEAGEGEISVIGGLDGEFSAFAADGLLTDLSDLAEELSELGINEDYLELGRLGTDQQLYIPWMQATYIMVARNEALEYLPDGVDVNDMTWEDLTEWGANIEAETGERKLGFPAGEDGLLHRFFQGYAYPAFTGGVNTTFTSDAAVEMWNWMTDTWQYVNPQSTTYGFMQEPLQSGEVWVAWDHVVRLIDALESDPEAFTAFPVPSGPEGKAFMPVIAGLGIPTTAPNPDGAKELIRYLLQPETQATTLTSVSFFPVIGADLPGDLSPGLQAEADAVAAQQEADDALPALLPVGLGDQGGAYSQVFRDAFQAIVINGEDPAAVLEGQLPNLQAVFDASGAACWAPDPESDGPCQAQ